MTDKEALRAALAPRPARTGEVVPLLKQRPDDPWSERAGKAEVRRRSGGRCELRGPTCRGEWTAHDVDHVFGHLGPDPHNPDRMLHLCGFGNANGGCHQWVSQTKVGRAASIYVVERIAAGEL